MKKIVGTFVFLFLATSLQLQAAGTTQGIARKIMGKNYLGIAEVEKCFVGVHFYPEYLKPLAVIPYSEATLQETADSHVLFPGFSLNVSDVLFFLMKKGVRIRANESIFPAESERIAHDLIKHDCLDSTYFSVFFPWCSSSLGPPPLAIARVAPIGPRWYLVRKEIFFPNIPKSHEEMANDSEKEGKIFAENGKYEKMSLCELLYFIALYKNSRGEELFSKTSAETKDLSPEKLFANSSYPLYVHFGGGELKISDSFMYYASGFKDRPRIGLAASRKSD